MSFSLRDTLDLARAVDLLPGQVLFLIPDGLLARFEGDVPRDAIAIAGYGCEVNWVETAGDIIGWAECFGVELAP